MFRPAGSGGQLHLDEKAQCVVPGALLDHAFQVMGLAYDTHHRIARERAIHEHFREPLSDLLQISEHGVPAPAVRTCDKYHLRTQVTADQLGISHELQTCTY